MQFGNSRFKSIMPLLLVLAVFLITAVVINPLREAGILDDWSYARTVLHLMNTGNYQLDAWLAANMPFQAYWGLLFSRVLGYSHITLRLSTLVLSLIGVISLYSLAREHDLSPTQAGLLSLLLLTSPLYLAFSFLFMTEVPFLALCILALYLYTRAVRQSSVLIMLLASVAAAGAILTRQFGAAFVPGIGLLWLLSQDRWKQIPLYATGLVLPLAAVAWQLYAGSLAANWMADWVTRAQLAYLSSPIIAFDIMWRLMVILQYMALFAIPLALAGIWEFISEMRRMKSMDSPEARLTLKLMIGFALFIFVTSLIGTLVLNRNGSMPLIRWTLAIILGSWHPALLGVLTLLTIMGAFVLGRIVVLRLMRIPKGSTTAAHERVVDYVTFFMLIEQLVFFQFEDRYLLPLLPFTLIVAGRYLLPRLSQAVTRIAVTATLMILVLCAGWVREGLAVNAAHWAASEALLAEGADPADIGSIWEWEAYHGSFDRYLAGLTDLEDGSVAEYTGPWRLEQAADVHYLVIDSRTMIPEEIAANWQEVERTPYRDGLFRTRYIVVYRRID